MNRFLSVCTCVTLLTIGSAQAADMPIKAPRPAAAVATSWTACYIGANIGYAWADKRFTFAGPGGGPIDEGRHTADGVVGGGQIGCDWQVGANWVIGIQGLWDVSGQDGSHQIPPGAGFFYSTDIKSFGTITASIGYLVQPSALLYAKFGVGWVDEDYRFFNAAGTRFASASETRFGLDVGVGLSWLISPNWSVFIEYDHIFLRDRTLRFGGGTDTFDERIRQDVDKILIGASYRFGSPVGARH